MGLVRMGTTLSIPSRIEDRKTVSQYRGTVTTEFEKKLRRTCSKG